MAQDHSWYKHLPLFPPGIPFACFLHPHAHQISKENAAGVIWKNIVAYSLPGEIEGWRTSNANEREIWGYEARNLTTDKWCERLEFWQYCTLTSYDFTEIARWYVRAGEAEFVWLPAEVLALGTVKMRGTVNRRIRGIPTIVRRYEAERGKHNLPTLHDDRKQQLDDLLHSLQRVVFWIYDCNS